MKALPALLALLALALAASAALSPGPLLLLAALALAVRAVERVRGRPSRFFRLSAPMAYPGENGTCGKNVMEGCVLWVGHAGEHTSQPYYRARRIDSGAESVRSDPSPFVPDPVVATIQLRRGRLVLVRRRA